MHGKVEPRLMSKTQQLTDVGRFIKATLAGNPRLKNREVADLVVNHFPDRKFNALALRQRVANFKYLERNRRTIRIVTRQKTQRITVKR